METIEINPFEGGCTTIGFQYDHNQTQIEFKEIEGENNYLKLMDSENTYEAVPIPDNTFILSSTFTDKPYHYKAQIMKKVDDELISHSPIFEMVLRPSIGSGEAKETVPTVFKTMYDKMVEIINSVKEKLDNGEFKGEKGDPYTSSEEFQRLSKEVKDNAKESKEALENIATKVDDFNNSYDSKMEDLDNEYTQMVENLNTKNDVLLKQYNENAKETMNSIDEAKQRAIDEISSILGDTVSQFYVGNNKETYIDTSDENTVDNLVIEGNTVQNTTKGYQLFDIDNAIDGFVDTDGTINSSSLSYNEKVSHDFVPVKTTESNIVVHVQATLDNSYNWFGIGFYDENKDFIVRYTETIDPNSTGFKEDTKVFSIPSTARYMKMSFREFEDGMLRVEYGKTLHDYEPYTGGVPSPNPSYPQKVKGVDKLICVFKGDTSSSELNYTLLKPLHRIGNKFDYIDYAKNKIIRNIGSMTFDGSSDENWSTAGPSTSTHRSYYISDTIPTINNSYTIMCDKLRVYIDSEGIWNAIDDDICNMGNSNRAFYICIPNTANVREWLSQNPITVYYQLNTPIEEDIPTELLDQMDDLFTYYPTTEIIWNVDIEPPISFDYKLSLKSLMNKILSLIKGQ